jgi:hypothetical protein
VEVVGAAAIPAVVEGADAVVVAAAEGAVEAAVADVAVDEAGVDFPKPAKRLDAASADVAGAV